MRAIKAKGLRGWAGTGSSRLRGGLRGWAPGPEPRWQDLRLGARPQFRGRCGSRNWTSGPASWGRGHELWGRALCLGAGLESERGSAL